MVYESDFYTTRRPYTRPISSHYTVTNPGAVIRPIPPLQQQQVRRFPHHLPFVAHKKLVSVVHTPYPVVYYTHTVPVPIRIYSRVRPSVIAAELQRIRDLPRPSSISYVSRYLNSKDNILFDDETRDIRARADSLLRRIHVFVPRPTSSDFAEVIVPERMRSDDYIRRVLTARKNAKKDEPESANWYETPEHRQFGSGNLAAVTYTGGKAHSRRRPYYKLADLRSADVQSDVNLLSFYAKNRQAAASACHGWRDRVPELNEDPSKKKKQLTEDEEEEDPDPPLTEREQRKARALAEERVYSVPRKASPDPEPVYKPSIEIVNKPQKCIEPVPIIEVEPSVVIVKPEIVKDVESQPESILIEENRVNEQEMPEQSPPELTLESTEEPSIPTTESEIIMEPESKEIFQPEPKDNEEIVEAEPLIDEPLTVVEEPVVEENIFVESDEPQHQCEDATELKNDEDVIDTISADPAESSTENLDICPVEVQPNVDDDDDDDEVLQRKLDDEELRRQVEELKRQAEEEKRRQAEEARLSEERYKAEIEERARLAEEARQARLREIEEQERLEAERQAEDARITAERLRDMKIAEEQKRAAEYEATLAIEEEERYVIEKAGEEARKRQEREEKLVSEVALGAVEEVIIPESTSDECHCHDSVKSQDREERVDSPDADDDTQIEEEPGCISTDHNDISEHYDGEHEGFNSVNELDTPVEVVPQVEEINSEEENEES